VLVGWLLVAALSWLRVQQDAAAGRRAADSAREAGRTAGRLLEARPLPDLERARRHFVRAHHRARSVALLPVRVLPVLGRQLRAIDAMSTASARIAGVAIDGLTSVRRELDRPHQAGPQRVALLRSFAGVARKAHSRLGGLDLGPNSGLLPPVARTRTDLDHRLAEVRSALVDADAVATTVADLLEGPRRYLVLAGNNAEMRAGAGMPLSIGELETGDGRMHLTDVRSVNYVPVPAGAVPVTGDFAARWGWLSPGTDWRNLLASPRFDVSAPLAARMWEAAGNRPVDGVFMLDPPALEHVLAATGPVDVAGRTISAENVVPELLVEQYLRFPDLEQRPERREQIGVIAQATVDALDERGWSAAALASTLSQAVRGRHLMAWSRAATEEHAWRTAGVDGSLRPESLLVGVLNRGGNKLDRYLKVRADLDLRSVHGTGAATLRLVLANEAPQSGPAYVLGPHPDISAREGEYVGIVAVSLPGTATAGAVDGAPALAAAGPDGPTRVIAVPVSVPRGEDRTVVVRFTVPGAHGSLRVEPSARVPRVPWTRGRTSWRDDEARRIRW
jgi:hypothetical protein